MNIKFFGRVVALATVVCSCACGMDMEQAKIGELYKNHTPVKRLEKACEEFVQSAAIRAMIIEAGVQQLRAVPEPKSYVQGLFERLDIDWNQSPITAFQIEKEQFSGLSREDKDFYGACCYMNESILFLLPILNEGKKCSSDPFLKYITNKPGSIYFRNETLPRIIGKFQF